MVRRASVVTFARTRPRTPPLNRRDNGPSSPRKCTMRKGFLGSLAAVLTGAGLALAQSAPVFRPARDFSSPPASPSYAVAAQYASVPQFPMQFGPPQGSYPNPMMAPPGYVQGYPPGY